MLTIEDQAKDIEAEFERIEDQARSVYVAQMKELFPVYGSYSCTKWGGDFPCHVVEVLSSKYDMGYIKIRNLRNEKIYKVHWATLI